MLKVPQPFQERGVPFERRDGRYVNLARAEYALLDRVGQNWTVGFRRLPCDLAPLKSGLLASSMPHARWGADGWVAG
ncbi:hypothetical protein [Deinococcus aerophilus]|uniref:hypothetical protein n=1 Tax=Deinococcus aerophilus TaxID=522488 RepID=UPI001665AE5F|nr:hypothetical protein [Deinococcus aerophilus]